MKEYQDYYFRKAKKEGALSRAFYKLAEIDAKHHLIHPGLAVLDLGCSPGSWLQYIAQRVGKTGTVLGVDRVAPIEKAASPIQFLQADILTMSGARLLELAGRPFDVVLSDAAPNTTGERFVDQQNSLRLAERVLEIALCVLKPGGHLVFKIFQGPDTKQIFSNCRTRFKSVHTEKPRSSRKESFEVFGVALSRKGP